MSRQSTPDTVVDHICVEAQSKLQAAFSDKQAESDELRAKLHVSEDRALGYAEEASKVRSMWQAVEPALADLTAKNAELTALNKALKGELKALRQGGDAAAQPSLGSLTSGSLHPGDDEPLPAHVQGALAQQQGQIQALKMELVKARLDSQSPRHGSSF